MSGLVVHWMRFGSRLPVGFAYLASESEPSYLQAPFSHLYCAYKKARMLVIRDYITNRCLASVSGQT